ncbi:TetR/AcrR family transcriptional regulator [Actinomycetospora sp. TBRC 11914]|uniref:TetR/AcrR family transcriptional regulator n=1 Tax=Actinomycetospora sp. TBRC 11914 TaxID=2729387 RepID=UPI00145D5978|nr:TetR/AcrR family transcriptional regulator C-terminal domain-containing protein [Actinomycetospora sp. TBRC 11914]NMO92675.1 TetR family transcriptional regulator [Actinomycetospora sp. TBRC 11914]
MSPQARRSARRTEALSRERIVDAAIAVLDTAGEGGLTFRALSEHLATGPGAIYWHVANKGELLGAATDAVVAAALAATPPRTAPDPSPQERIRAVALALFDAIDAHPWVGVQLSASAWQVTTTPRLLESTGRQVRAMGVPRAEWFTVTSVLVQYILGAAAQNAANAQVLGPDADRDTYLDDVARVWEALDPEDYPFTRVVGDQMRGHDDREQFLAGVDLFLAGITARWPPAS